ncbi:S41 family peptidase [Brevundimonas sp.]|uniref:S41 family peptidase n=1 Tax=Brevundimonas sp. TaxID=1871086 RepID=UPI002BFBA090|nr:S41 family peptidase [Brevundimonas sp.]HWQ86286.1 S41 family peptidase [Brevundimonas sp.]
MNRPRLIASACLLACLAGTPALAQRAAPTAVARAEAAAPLGVEQRAAAIAAIIQTVESRYVFPDRVPAIRDRLNEGLASGRYDTADPGVFAERVTADLRESSGDGHMYLNHAPDQYAAAAGSDAEADDNPALQAIWAAAARRSNNGLTEMRILPGNVRYLRISGFHWVADRTGQAYDDAMRFMRDGDALVIDLRGNGGGDHAAVRYLLSHFMEPDQLDITFLEAGKDPIQSRTLDNLPAGRLRGKPLYVLISRQVGSAAEAFAYDVQQFRLGTLVGATTGGAANNNTFFPVAPAFMLSVSYGRPVHPVSGANWEAVGVSPDVAVDPAIALDTAALLAVKSLLARAGADPADRADWAWAETGIESRLHPATIAPARLRALAGTYGGRVILFEDGKLFWRRANGQKVALVPMTAEGLFMAEGYDDRLRLRLAGEALEMHWIDEPAPSRFTRD